MRKAGLSGIIIKRGGVQGGGEVDVENLPLLEAVKNQTAGQAEEER